MSGRWFCASRFPGVCPGRLAASRGIREGAGPPRRRRYGALGGVSSRAKKKTAPLVGLLVRAERSKSGTRWSLPPAAPVGDQRSRRSDAQLAGRWLPSEGSFPSRPKGPRGVPCYKMSLGVTTKSTDQSMIPALRASCRRLGLGPPRWSRRPPERQAKGGRGLVPRGCPVPPPAAARPPGWPPGWWCCPCGRTPPPGTSPRSRPAWRAAWCSAAAWPPGCPRPPAATGSAGARCRWPSR